MTNAPINRKTHVTRIVGTNKDGDVLQDIWADVERIDAIVVHTQTAQLKAQGNNQWQEIEVRLNWRDDPQQDGYDPDDLHTTRNHDIVKVCDPASGDLDDPDEWIPVKSIRHVDMNAAGADGTKGIRQKRFVAKAVEATGRKVEKRRIYHYDTSIDDDAQAAFDADPTLKSYVVPGKQYERDEATRDDDQYIEHEIILAVSRDDAEFLAANGHDQGREMRFKKNQYFIDESDPARLEEVGNEGNGNYNPPYRLDPFQAIVNCQFVTGEQAVIGIQNRTNDPVTNNQDKQTRLSKDGQILTPGFGAGTSNAASGLGYTVVGGDTSVVFGKPKDGAACFLTLAGDRQIKRGILNEDGELQFTAVDGAPPGGVSLSFAGEAFFIGLGADYGLSFDGTTFQTVSVFPRSENDPSVFDPNSIGISSGNPNAGTVAYDKDNNRYVAAGSYERWYNYTYLAGDIELESFTSDRNFMSSISSDGINWTDKYDLSEGVGLDSDITGAIGGGSGRGTVAFGNGLFVAAATWKERANPETGPNYYPACAIATSADGENWSNRRLPETIGSYSFGAGGALISGGNGAGVKFIKTGTGGFFIASGQEFVQRYPVPADGQYAYSGKLWVSEDGLHWSLMETRTWQIYFRLSAINRNVTPDSTKLFYL